MSTQKQDKKNVKDIVKQTKKPSVSQSSEKSDEKSVMATAPKKISQSFTPEGSPSEDEVSEVSFNQL